MKITEVDISKIIKNFGEEKPRIFQREAQFQFELAWELHKAIGNDGEVLLEVLSCSKLRTENKKTKRFYSDIILKDKNGFIVIELKYKTKMEKVTVFGVELTGQGAQDEGRYDYLWDIKRIELLKNHEDGYDCNPELGNFLGGYAIMLTNDNQYWEITKEIAEANGRNYSQFCIGEDDEVKGEVDWNSEEPPVWTRSRPKIKFNDKYRFKWEQYYFAKDGEGKTKSKEFRYLITHIE